MAGIRRNLKETYKYGLRKLFEQGQRFGFDLLPRHFYSEIPDIRQLKKTADWKAPYSMIGVKGAEIEDQLQFLRAVCLPGLVEAIPGKNIHARAATSNGEGGFGVVEADFLYAFIVSQRPSQIFQIGCGVSTAVCRMAAEDAGFDPEIICVEPFPTTYLVEEAKAGRIRLLKQKVQTVELMLVESLGPDTLFFVDSTHTLGPAGEVSRIILEMLPRLKRGARVHFHDIKFPYDYDRHILDRMLFFHHESVLLHAFLAYNSRFSILASLSMLHYFRPEMLSTYLPNYRPQKNDAGLGQGEGHFPSSTYLQVTG